MMLLSEAEIYQIVYSLMEENTIIDIDKLLEKMNLAKRYV